MDDIMEAFIRERGEMLETGLQLEAYVELPAVSIQCSGDGDFPAYDAQIIAECRGCGRLCVCDGMIENGTISPYDSGSHSPPHMRKCGDKMPFSMIAYRRSRYVRGRKIF